MFRTERGPSRKRRILLIGIVTAAIFLIYFCKWYVPSEPKDIIKSTEGLALVQFEPLKGNYTANWYARFENLYSLAQHLSAHDLPLYLTALVNNFGKHAEIINVVDFTTGTYLQTLGDCVPVISREYNILHISSQLYTCLADHLNIGPFPRNALHDTEDRSSHLASTQVPSSIYLIPSVNTSDKNHNGAQFPCSITSDSRRGKLLQTLKSWVNFAAEHRLLWWLTYGTLLGAVR